jgi:hypothetical protein
VNECPRSPPFVDAATTVDDEKGRRSMAITALHGAASSVSSAFFGVAHLARRWERRSLGQRICRRRRCAHVGRLSSRSQRRDFQFQLVGSACELGSCGILRQLVSVHLCSSLLLMNVSVCHRLSCCFLPLWACVCLCIERVALSFITFEIGNPACDQADLIPSLTLLTLPG